MSGEPYRGYGGTPPFIAGAVALGLFAGFVIGWALAIGWYIVPECPPPAVGVDFQIECWREPPPAPTADKQPGGEG